MIEHKCKQSDRLRFTMIWYHADMGSWILDLRTDSKVLPFYPIEYCPSCGVWLGRYNELIDMYLSGKTAKEVAGHYDITLNRVKWIFKKYNVKKDRRT